MEIGGFSEALPAQLQRRGPVLQGPTPGYRIVWLANVEMYHFESRTRQRIVEGWEKDRAVERWGMPRHDQYFPEA